ncbi:GNAT family N-acetyltransferase [Pectobacterium cacticida]|uniref:GNAT family N-acetyltransferase n=1 Tax=Pectobacterium cacticida TaxID=69221 RepID=A0ABZ2GAR7_9GAMM|nr:GNAT family N-acetyltransferase [Pectobacterium cacticida]UYX07335.1 GNAT family N-acetyltransferase [Pectobacterium cacticida]
MITATSVQLQHRVRPITAQDDAAIAQVIRQVSAEFGLTADKGYTVSDPNLDALFSLYNQPRSAYWVIEYQGRVVGGGGIAPLVEGEEDVCELQKMYCLPVVRGKGLARQLAIKALDFARQHAFRRCYLETTAHLTSAIRLYESLGFEPIPYSMGNTGHTDCEVTMLKIL